MAASSLLPNSYLSVSGSQIVDQNGTPVRIASIGWNQNFNNIPASVAEIGAAGFNCIRVSWVNATMQQDLARIDQVVAAAAGLGLKVVLDHHTDEAGTPADGWGSQQRNGLPYDLGGASDGTNAAGVKGTVTLQKFVDDWVTVAHHYAGDQTVIGYDLHNEPLHYGGMSTWGDGNPNTDLTLIYKQAGDAIHAIDPRPLIICEGPQNYGSSFANVGPAPWGDLSVVRTHPVVLHTPNKVVYSIHDYPAYVAGFKPDSGPDKVAQMNKIWGYLVTENIAPVWIGEMGCNADGSYNHEDVAGSLAWAKTLLDYMNGKLGAQGGPVFHGNQQGVSGNWWAWGDLEGQQLVGVVDSSGNLRPAQKALWSQLLPMAAVASPAPTPAPAPVPPVPAPTPTPAQPLQTSPNNTVIAAGAGKQIVDINGHVWKLVKGQVSVDGAIDTTTANVTELAFVNGHIWQENASNLWWSKVLPTDSWTPANGTSKSPLPVVAPPTVSLSLLSTGQSTVISGTDVLVTSPDGTTMTISGTSAAHIKLGTTGLKIVISEMATTEVIGGSADATIVIDSGSNTYTVGSGKLTVTGGPDVDVYHYGPGCGLLTIQNFSASKGDALMVSSALNANFLTGPNTSGGTLLTFGKLAVGIDIKGIPPTTPLPIAWV